MELEASPGVEVNKYETVTSRICRGRAIRTPINGFGDRYSTLELCPYFIQV